MNTTPKLVHIIAPRRRRVAEDTHRALCGRFVGIMALVSTEKASQATCVKCAVAAVTAPLSLTSEN
jgi:hypothetical protein